MNTTGEPVAFDEAARLPAEDDNLAIATRRLEAGTLIRHGAAELTLPHTVLEGHRFVLEPIASSEFLLSWGLPFGTASRDLAPGEYACNERILAALAERDIDFRLPDAANFVDRLERYEFDEAGFRPGRQVDPVAEAGTFAGYRRSGARGDGSRNYVVILATTSRANSFASTLARRFDALGSACPNVDGVVAVSHTEGGTESVPHNLEFVLRALAGFVVHPNVGAVLAVDYPGAGYGNAELRDYMTTHGYRLGDVAHHFLTIESEFEAELGRAERVIREWLPVVTGFERSDAPLSGLKVALQCGGSDAFSGISGNALAGWVAKLLIRHGGSANIAETDELIGAEAYVLENVRDLETARRLLERIEAFKARVGHHGATAEGNPTGGNTYRGLYNIAIKSLGAARKIDPEVRLDHVLEYAEPMDGPGGYFMDSPGNDLESIAGQVAAGSNLILFTTGSGSITNFPFVPTLKFVTTSGRFRMLADEMDVDAGRYNEGESMSELGDEVFALARAVASGERSKGERAGHSQVQLWRDWPQVDDSQLDRLRAEMAPDGAPLAASPAEPTRLRFQALATDRGPVGDQVALVMPTSLCSGQVARMIAEGLNARLVPGGPVARYVSLVHTEGCGSTNTNDAFLQTLLGHLRHPFVHRALLLEHGCEQTHNDAVRHYLAQHGADPEDYGWASIQLDGGLNSVGGKVSAWFERALEGELRPLEVAVGAEALSIALLASGEPPDDAAEALAELAGRVVSGGGTVVVPSRGPLAESVTFRKRLLAPGEGWHATLAYGQPVERPGLHVMDAPTAHPTELVTGLGGTGAQLMIGYIGAFPLHAHPMIPLLQVSGAARARARFVSDLDVELHADGKTTSLAVLEQRISEVASRTYAPRLVEAGFMDFQLTRGRLGISV